MVNSTDVVGTTGEPLDVVVARIESKLDSIIMFINELEKLTASLADNPMFGMLLGK